MNSYRFLLEVIWEEKGERDARVEGRGGAQDLLGWVSKISKIGTSLTKFRKFLAGSFLAVSKPRPKFGLTLSPNGISSNVLTQT